jgi:hypothetical protein
MIKIGLRGPNNYRILIGFLFRMMKQDYAVGVTYNQITISAKFQLNFFNQLKLI